MQILPVPPVSGHNLLVRPLIDKLERVLRAEAASAAATRSLPEQALVMSIQG